MSGGGLRSRLLQGSAYLIVRRGIGLVVSLGGMLLLTRLIGAGAYGSYATITIVLGYATDLCINGTGAYLIRADEETAKKRFDLAFTYLAAVTAVTAALGCALAGVVSGWFHQPGTERALALSMLTIVPNAYTVPAMAQLERELRYRSVAYIEMYAQIAYYATALGLACLGFGLWAPVCGGLAQSAVIAALCARFSRYWPSFWWNAAQFKEMFGYGIGHTASMRVIGLRPVLGALIVSRFAGAEAVAFVSLVGRLADSLGFVGAAIQRMTFSFLARIRQEPGEVEKAMNGMLLAQVLSVAPLLVGFSVCAPWALTLLFGPGWAPVLSLYPYRAAVCIAACLFSVHVQILYVLGRNKDVVGINLLHIALFAGAAAAFVPHAGLAGYAAAEAVSIASYFACDAPIRRLYRLRYRDALLCAAVCVPPLFFPIAPRPEAYLLFVPPLIYALVPGTRRKLARLAGEWTRARSRRRGAPESAQAALPP